MAIVVATSFASLGRYATLSAEYYLPNFVRAERQMASLSHRCRPLTQCTSSAYPITYGVLKPREVPDSSCRLARIENSEAVFIFGDELPAISDRQFDEYARSEVRQGDIVVAIGGDIGPLGIIADAGGYRININRHLARISPDTRTVDPYYLTAFLATRPSRDLLVREIRGAVQAGINIADLKLHPVFLPAPDVQRALGDRVRNAEVAMKASKRMALEARRLIDTRLQMTHASEAATKLSATQSSVVSLADVAAAGRVDAQCYSPAALFYDAWLRKHSRCEPLSQLLEPLLKGRKQTETSGGELAYCSIKHLSDGEVLTDATCASLAALPLARRNDLMLAVTGATIGKVGLVRRYEALTFSGDLLRLRVSGGLDPHYLLLALEHTVVQAQFQRWITGSTNGHLAPRDVRRVLVPRLGEEDEVALAELMRGSLDARAEAKREFLSAIAGVEALVEETSG